jgi:hypothetical protein
VSDATGRRKEPPCCWGCGRPALYPACGWADRMRRLGWGVRYIRHGRLAVTETELLCPDCLARYGWPALTGGWELEDRRRGR